MSTNAATSAQLRFKSTMAIHTRLRSLWRVCEWCSDHSDRGDHRDNCHAADTCRRTQLVQITPFQRRLVRNFHLGARRSHSVAEDSVMVECTNGGCMCVEHDPERSVLSSSESKRVAERCKNCDGATAALRQLIFNHRVRMRYPSDGAEIDSLRSFLNAVEYLVTGNFSSP